MTATADLHIHTVLSPCAGEEMTPPRVLARAAEQGLQFIAITDHNSALNVPAFWEAAQAYPVEVIPGMELQTREDIHLVCLFDTPEKALRLQEMVDRALPDVPNREEFFGPQWIVDATGRVTGTEERLLINSVGWSLAEAVERVLQAGGVCIAAHIDRQSFSLLGVLGLIPPDLPLAALEIARPASLPALSRTYPELRHYPPVFSSDAHYLADVGRVHTVLPREVEDAVSLIQFFKKALAKRPPVYRRRRARNLERGDVPGED